MYSYYLHNLRKVKKEHLQEDKYKYKLHYIYREFQIDFFKMDLNSLPKNFKFIADGYSAYPLAAQQFFIQSKGKINFDITQVIGLTNDDAVSKAFRPYKQMIERLNRTYKQSYRPSNGFDNIDGANYDLSLWVAYYNFLRPHEHAGYKVLNKVDKLEGASNIPGKWQLLIFLGQQRILKMQQAKGSNCS